MPLASIKARKKPTGEQTQGKLGKEKIMFMLGKATCAVRKGRKDQQ